MEKSIRGWTHHSVGRGWEKWAGMGIQSAKQGVRVGRIKSDDEKNQRVTEAE